MSPYYFLFYIQYEVSIFKPEIQNDLGLKSPKTSEFAIYFNQQWSKILNYVDFIQFLTTTQLNLKTRDITKI